MINPLDHSQSINELPEPDGQAKSHSERLISLIKAECDHNGGAISFGRYMALALYEPESGYYAAGLQKFGEAGDFITAPEISPLFSRCVARQCAQVLPLLDNPVILEIGAGSGVMATDILLELESLNQLPDRYLILEISTYLRQKQKEVIESKAAHLFDRVEWLNALPDKPIQAVVLANEVLDAMPVESFQTTDDGVKQLFVEVVEDGVNAIYKDAESSVSDAVNTIEQRAEMKFELQYQSEFNPTLDAWIASVADCLEKGIVLLIDYGYPVSEYYHPQRHMGTLICHYQHRAHADPFWYPGLQDITAFVDFSAVAYAAVDAGLEVRGYTTQAAFLMASGIAQLHQEAVTDEVSSQINLSQQIKTLTLPSEMGERFKVMALGKNIDEPLQGFLIQDFRSRL